jgi:2-methylisocitrate lyase-like PEP mutase family enzyme
MTITASTAGTAARRERALAFRALHDDPALVAPNAWDPISAVAIERAGAKAIATTSYGVAASRGVADGGGLNAEVALDALERIIGAVTLPVTADLERGYAGTVEGAVETVSRAIDLGIAGLNIEDSLAQALVPAAEQVTLLGAVAEAIGQSGVPAFLNARTDTYLFRDPAASDEDLLTETIDRGLAYVRAGADGLFVPGLTEHAAIAAVCGAVTVPVNVMLDGEPVDLDELFELGVRRVTWGPALQIQAQQRLQQDIAALLSGKQD